MRGMPRGLLRQPAQGGQRILQITITVLPRRMRQAWLQQESMRGTVYRCGTAWMRVNGALGRASVRW
jgi:hypothetical protein